MFALLKTESLKEPFRRVVFPFLGMLILLSLPACNGSKSLAKKANQLQQAGMYSDAAQFYYNSLLKNSNNVDARIGLTNTGQKVLNDKLAEFSKARAVNDSKKAVYAYKDAAVYRSKLDRLGIKLNAPDYLSDDFEESKNLYVKELYDKGNDLLSDKNFDEANRIFKELSSLESNYKDVSDLQSMSRNEPFYISGTELFDAHQWHKSYYQLDEIYRRDPGYKDVAILRKECLDKGQYPVAIVPFENASRTRDIDKQIQAYVLTALSQIDDPFLKIVERDNMDMILKEQRINLSGIVNEQSAAKVGNLLGAKAILTGTVLSYATLPGKMKVTRKDGYEAYQVKLYNQAEDKNYYETRYKPVTYNEYYNSNEVTVSFQYKAVSLETGEILFSKVVNKKVDSDVYFGTYDGEITALYSADKEGVVTANRDHNQLVSLMRASRELKPVSDLAKEAFGIISQSISIDLVNQVNKE